MLIWRAADEYNMPMLEFSKFGWIKGYDIMVPIHRNVYVAPNVPLQHVVASQGKHVAADHPNCHARHITNIKQMNIVQMTM